MGIRSAGRSQTPHKNTRAHAHVHTCIVLIMRRARSMHAPRITLVAASRAWRFVRDPLNPQALVDPHAYLQRWAHRLDAHRDKHAHTRTRLPKHSHTRTRQASTALCTLPWTELLTIVLRLIDTHTPTHPHTRTRTHRPAHPPAHTHTHR